MPTTSTVSTPWPRSQSPSGVPSSSAPSNPLYAAACCPLRKVASTAEVSRSGWKSAPGVPATQWGGQDAA
jgi:hypothetical protein